MPKVINGCEVPAKVSLIQLIMSKIDKAYIAESAVYLHVKQALKKLSVNELDSLLSMISTSIK